MLVGMPAVVRLDLTTLWHRETELAGAYAYGTETLADGIAAGGPSSWRSSWSDRPASGASSRATYPLADYKAAIEHAADAGRRGAVKIAFDLRAEKERNR